jgi:hypothetical protein
MSSELDIVVTEADGWEKTLAVEVKASLSEEARRAGEAHLKRYMKGMRCPTGLLVTPDEFWLYRDTFRGRDESSIETIGRFSLGRVLGPKPAQSEGLELKVLEWLESLRSSVARSRLPPETKAVIEEHILPLLEGGEVGAARAWEATAD